jgi:hypothetical protein
MHKVHDVYMQNQLLKMLDEYFTISLVSGLDACLLVAS